MRELSAPPRRRFAVFLAFLLLAGASPGALAQQGILTFAPQPARVGVAPGGQAVLSVRIENESVFEADDIEFMWVGPEGFSLQAEPASVAVLEAFASTSVRLTVGAEASAAIGERGGDLLEVIYTYCIDDVCYEILEPVKIALSVVPASEPASDAAPTDADRRERDVWPLVGIGLVVLLVGFSWAAQGAPRLRPALYAALVVASVLCLGFGVLLAQHRQAQAVGAVLCTSCVGIEAVETTRAELSAGQEAAVDRVAKPVDLLVFSAAWCRSCPYAKAVVELMASRNPLIRYRIVDAEVERDLAVLHGVTRSGRTVVPAITCLQTGEVLFGAENLPERLLRLLEGAQ